MTKALAPDDVLRAVHPKPRFEPWTLRLVLKDGTAEESTTYFLNDCPTTCYVRPATGGRQQWFWVDPVATDVDKRLAVYTEDGALR